MKREPHVRCHIRATQTVGAQLQRWLRAGVRFEKPFSYVPLIYFKQSVQIMKRQTEMRSSSIEVLNRLPVTTWLDHIDSGGCAF